MKKSILLALPLLLVACSPVASVESEALTLDFQEEMLFDGPNTFSAAHPLPLESLAQNLELDSKQIKKVRVKQVLAKYEKQYAGLAESMLLQIVSDNHDLVTVASISPIDAGSTEFNFDMAEDVNIKDYLADKGATWVLDVNLSTEAEVLSIRSALIFSIEYKE